MSKKMMKRSLALGALMAFVITGSAMAADKTVGVSNNTTHKINDAAHQWVENNKLMDLDSPVYNLTNNGIHITGAQPGEAINGNGEANLTTVDLNITVKNTNDLTNPGNGLYTVYGGKLNLTVSNEMVLDVDGHGINAGAYAGDKITINKVGNNSSVIKITAGENGIYTHKNGKLDADGNIISAEIYAKNVTIDATKYALGDAYKGYAVIAAAEKSEIKIDASGNVKLTGINGAVKAMNGSSVNVNAGGDVNIISGIDGVVALKGGTAVVTGNNIKIDVDSASGYDSYVYGVHAGERSIGNGSITIGDENTKSVIIDVNGKDANGIFARAYNNSGKEEDQSSVIVKGAKLDITVDGTGDGIAGIWAASGTESKNAPSSIVTLETADTKISATNGVGIVSYSNGTVDVKGNLDIDANCAIQTRGYAKTFINTTKDKTVTIDGDIAFTKEYDQANVITDAEVVLNLSNGNSYLEGNIYVDNFDSVVNNKATYKDITGMALGISNGAYWATQAGDGAVDNFVNDLTMSNGTIKHNNKGNITVNNYSGNGIVELNTEGHLHIDAGAGSLNLTMAEKTADDLNDAAGLTTVAQRLGVKEEAIKDISAKVVMAEGDVKGETTGVVTFVAPAEDVNKEEVPADNAKVASTEGDVNDNADNYWHGVVEEVTEKVNTKNQAIGDAGISLKLHWRAHMNDMNKRMGELRNAEGEHGVWARMVRGESEYKNTKAQYNQYQLGYDEKLSVDKRWTVGAAVTFAEGDANYGQGSTEDKSTAFAIYGSKLNNDGTFVDLIARYAHIESDLDDANSGKGDYATNGMSVSAEFGKRIQQGNGLWIEPQVELTYGTVDSAEFQLGQKTVTVGDMDSLIGRVGFSLGKDIKQGNVYARASYLYDFDGETDNAFSNGTDSRTIAEDLGGGWWEVGVGANINLSKATYVYADVEKTFGGEVDTNWQWNLGVRYSF